ncbi:hypothetical protein [Arcobacter sp. FWKO B]|uniref:hypothetical protein n=1 Tax=Arcobacter sp. FWKO B TaxID=2593672 RepID=UPI0018A43EE9|nr:hypothetical protein [Arcobacter sp. FWKO B]QOG11626.1 type II and III secretion system protein [Arcobacter sp. FWKO B]
MHLSLEWALLNIVPVSTTIESMVNFSDGGQQVATAPIINIKEAGTVIQARESELVVIGGLINETYKKDEDSVPGISNLPVVGGLFKKKSNSKEKRELIILLKLTVDN